MGQFESLRAFTRVIEHGGFAAAARTLGVSRSAVNKQVAELERELGTQLLRRSTRQVTPTEAGLAFYDRAVRVLADLEEAVASVKELQEAPVGNLRINAPMSFGTLHLARVVADYMAAHPRVHVEMVLADRFVDPIEEGFDVTVRIAEPQSSTSLIVKEIAPVRRVLCASPAYLAAQGEPSAPAELKAHRCLHYGYQASGNHWRLRRDGQETAVAINCVMWSNNGEVLKQAALHDQGIVLLPSFLVGDVLQTGELRSVLTAFAPVDLALCLVYPRHRHLSAKVRAFVALMEARFGGRPYWDLVG